MSWLFGDSLNGDNNQDPVGEAGAKFQRYTDPLAMIFGGKFIDLTSRKIPSLVNSGLSKITGPIDKIDQQINPLRPMIPGADAAGQWISNKPGSTIGMAVGSMFGGPALMGGAGSAGGASGGLFGTGGSLSGSGLFGAGLPAQSSFPIGASSGGGLQGSMTAPFASSSVLGGSSGAAASPLSGIARQMLMQQAMKGQSGQSNAPMYPISAVQDNGQASVTLGSPQPVIPSVNPQMLARALQRFQG